MTPTTDLADRYVQLWNEPDPERRHAQIRALWAPGGRQVLRPPADVAERAAALGFPAATLEVRGHEDLDVRVARAYSEFVAPGEFAFRLREAPVRLQDAVMLAWDMVPTGGGPATGGGRDLLLLDDDGRIRADYQFIDG